MQIEPIYRQIGALVRARRRELNWSQEKLADMLRISRGALANVERGRQRILIHQLFAIASALDTKVEQFLPQQGAAAGSSDPAGLPIPEHLSQRQKAQIAQIIQATETSTTTGKGE